MELDKFTRAYIECAIWSSSDQGDSLDLDDLAPATLAAIIDDCADFQASNANLLDESGLTSEQAGHDFWLTRNHHGAGFWDRGLGRIGEALTDMAHPYGECSLNLGEDGKLYL